MTITGTTNTTFLQVSSLLNNSPVIFTLNMCFQKLPDRSEFSNYILHSVTQNKKLPTTPKHKYKYVIWISNFHTTEHYTDSHIKICFANYFREP